jgi:cellulose synthase (UDP-forming)
MIWSGYRLLQGELAQPWTAAINGLWGFYNLCLLWSIIRAAVWQPPAAPQTAQKATKIQSLTHLQ